MTNNKIACEREECNQNQDAQERAIFIVPAKDCKFDHYAHIEIDGWDKINLSKLNDLDLQIISLMFDDMPIKAITDSLTLNHTKDVYAMLAKIREKIGVTTDHGLVAKLHKIGLPKLMS